MKPKAFISMVICGAVILGILLILATAASPALAVPGRTSIAIIALDNGTAFILEYQPNPMAIFGRVYGEQAEQGCILTLKPDEIKLSANGADLWTMSLGDNVCHFDMGGSTQMLRNELFKVYVPGIVK